LQSSETTPFKAVYTITSSGNTETVTFAQDPPKSLIGTQSGTMIDTGSQTVLCTNSSNTCISLSGSTLGASMQALQSVFAPKSVATSLNQIQNQIGAKMAGVSVSQSTKTVAGVASDCVTVSGGGTTTGTWCVAQSSGVLTYGQSGTTTVSLTSYSSSVDPSSFNLPAGATIITIPTQG
jgi:hypothetical protein